METPVPPGPPDGRRDNGLPSADWGALVDLDPRLSEALLGSLASADVPAFVEPAAGSHAWTRAAQLPDRPLHRLWVDPAKADTARAVVAAEVADLSALLAEVEPGATAHGFVQAVPRTAAARVLAPPVLPGAPTPTPHADEPPPSSLAGPVPDPAAPTPTRSGPVDDDDELFRQIVAGFGTEHDSPVPPWPVSEDVDPPRRHTGPPRSPRPGGLPRPEGPPRRRRTDPPPAGLPDWVEPAALDDDGHYVPPPPPPVPRLAPQKIAAAAALLAGLLLMFSPGVLLQPDTAGVNLFGVLLTVGGAAALVWLMRDAPPTDQGPDDGAVV